MIVEAIARLVEGESLSRDEAAASMDDIMEDRATPAQFGAFVTALRIKGETPVEIAGMAEVMRRKAVRVPTDLPVVDTCGTGGDGSGTFNISTAAAFVVAAAGQPVAKHGNRSMTSQCGSADVLEALGANISLGPDAVARCIEETGFGFMFAQAYHPAMKFAAPLRREIGIRTVFNILGPLSNPAGARRQVLGAPSQPAQARLAEALGLLGSERALVVHGSDGMDEVSVTGPSYVLDVNRGAVSESVIRPEQFGIAIAPAAALKGGTAAENAEIVRGVLGGQNGAPESGARRDIVALNAGAALVAAGVAPDMQTGVARALEILQSGQALARLDQFVKTSQALA
ncbi:MAG: Anthranilate phosphoribosyltransferase [uncultured Chloroflexi bacterium]|uniref:Anthranilate phosphoribosyltransferase n=1 Tax=uncultured Chloroflexota bacterium TaxID=166587 RepID=A0A6J4IG76_9CHLR|nr:MAG: Anthranilate phosphoribosyltransferase [uncultured Chloroflexota bacterium]